MAAAQRRRRTTRTDDETCTDDRDHGGGGSRGAGRATALAFARLGSNLVLAARDEVALCSAAVECRALGAQTLTVRTDVARVSDVDALVERTLQRFGRIDVWVGAAGVLAYGRVEDVPADVFDQVIATNLSGQVNGARAVLPVFRAQGRGTMVIIASLFAHVSAPYVSSYVASKFGVQGFVHALRQELLREPRINVRVISPATIDTSGYQRAGNRTGKRPRAIPPAISPQRVAAAVVRASRPRARNTRTVGRVQSLGIPLFALFPGLYDRGIRLTMDPVGLRSPAGDTDGTVFRPSSDEGPTTGGWRASPARATVPILAAPGALFALARALRSVRSAVHGSAGGAEGGGS